MRKFWLPTLPALFVLFGCATADEWSMWKVHTSHFASGAHLTFSMRNSGTTPARVTRHDVALASNQDWWGKAVTVDQQQIIER